MRLVSVAGEIHSLLFSTDHWELFGIIIEVFNSCSPFTLCLQVRQRVRLQQPCVWPGPAHVLQGVKSHCSCPWFLPSPVTGCSAVHPGSNFFYNKCLADTFSCDNVTSELRSEDAAVGVCTDHLTVCTGLVVLNVNSGSFESCMIIKFSVCGRTWIFFFLFTNTLQITLMKCLI